MKSYLCWFCIETGVIWFIILKDGFILQFSCLYWFFLLKIFLKLNNVRYVTKFCTLRHTFNQLYLQKENLKLSVILLVRKLNPSSNWCESFDIILYHNLQELQFENCYLYKCHFCTVRYVTHKNDDCSLVLNRYAILIWLLHSNRCISTDYVVFFFKFPFYLSL